MTRASHIHADLSSRERQLVRLVAAGKSNAEIAAALGISIQTVKNQLSAVYAKLGINRRLQLVLYAMQNGLT